jgi:hypothetical protein
MPSSRQNTSVENSGLIFLLEVLLIASFIIFLILLLLLPYNYKNNTASFVVSTMGIAVNLSTMAGCGIALKKLSLKRKSKK